MMTTSRKVPCNMAKLQRPYGTSSNGSADPHLLRHQSPGPPVCRPAFQRERRPSPSATCNCASVVSALATSNGSADPHLLRPARLRPRPRPDGSSNGSADPHLLRPSHFPVPVLRTSLLPTAAQSLYFCDNISSKGSKVSPVFQRERRPSPSATRHLPQVTLPLRSFQRQRRAFTSATFDPHQGGRHES
jgi:hypothetical protein